LSRAISGDRVRYLLADEVGLGKTIEAGLVMRELKLRGLVRRTLVVSPKGIATQWVAEMQAHFNEQFQLVLGDDIGTLQRLAPHFDKGADHRRSAWSMFDQVIVSLDSVKPMDKRRGWTAERVAEYNRSRFEDLMTAGWDLVVVDEAHRLGGSTDQVARYKLGKGLAEAAPYVLLLSATPHQGKTDAFHRLMNLLDEDSVEFRVREVLERKLSVIFDEFGIDKTGDVLDSAQAGELFEDVFASAILNPDGIETSVDHTVARLRDEIQQVREASAIYGLSEEPDVQAAERLRSHPLPHWVERMTVGYLNSHGGAASRKRSWWDLNWPDGQVHRKAVFNAREADRLTDATLLNLENNRVRGLALNLPQIAAGQPLPCVSVSGVPASISGLWGLFEIRLQAGMHQKTQRLRIPMVRRGYVSVFLSEEGKLFLPTARHIWDALQTAEAQVQATLGQDESITAHARLQEAAEQAGQALFDSLQQAHLASVAREEERGIVSFASRRKTIERVGLPEVRQFRLSRCDADEAEWRHELQSARQMVPEIRPLLMLQIIPPIEKGSALNE
jgi:hypothetical protein